jgi:hypothetical protein
MFWLFQLRRAIELTACVVSFLFLSMQVAYPQNNPFQKLIGTWRNLDTHVTIIITEDGFQSRRRPSRLHAAVDRGGWQL